MAVPCPWLLVTVPAGAAGGSVVSGSEWTHIRSPGAAGGHGLSWRYAITTAV